MRRVLLQTGSASVSLEALDRTDWSPLDAAESLDMGDAEDLGARYTALRKDVPHLSVLGGCCGTDSRHIDAIRRHCTS